MSFLGQNGVKNGDFYKKWSKNDKILVFFDGFLIESII
jgi:hypothetical protein